MISLLGLLDGFVGFLTGLDALRYVVAPWRYVFSASYHLKVQARWRQAPPSRVALEQIGGVFVAVLTVALATFIVAVIVSRTQ